eukprot:3915802-Pleurochrysis_carterae.AAC.1
MSALDLQHGVPVPDWQLCEELCEGAHEPFSPQSLEEVGERLAQLRRRHVRLQVLTASESQLRLQFASTPLAFGYYQTTPIERSGGLGGRVSVRAKSVGFLLHTRSDRCLHRSVRSKLSSKLQIG